MTFDEQTRRLTPDADLWLTKKEVQDEKERTFSQLMYLGIGDEPSNYDEWTEEQKEAWEREHPAPEPEPQEGK